jgi:hypothetical protein
VYGVVIGAYVLAIEAGLVAVLNIVVVVHILEQGAEREEQVSL